MKKSYGVFIRGCSKRVFKKHYGSIIGVDGFQPHYIKFDQMTPEESKIYDSLLNVRSKNFNRAIR
jgi:DNA replication initiation complex subunit (GINS family)